LILFSESNTRFLVEVPPQAAQQFVEAMADVDFAEVGRVTSGDRLEVYGLNRGIVLSSGIDELKEAWQRPLRW